MLIIPNLILWKAAWLAACGVAIAGWGVSKDCTDINSRAANFTFAGTDASRKWFDKQKTNLMALMSEFEVQVRQATFWCHLT